MVSIRKYHQSDRNAIIDICHRTGYMGEDAKEHFNDPYLFGLLFCLYYVDYEPNNCFIAFDDKNKQITGYVLGSFDSIEQDKQFRKKMVPRIIKRAFFYTFWRNFSTFRIFWHFWQNESKSPPIPDKEELISSFPAHLHIDILPEYHRRGIGTKLITSFESHLKSNGITGVHLGTSERNIKAVNFYKKNGYTIFYQSPSGYGMWPDANEVRSLIFTKKIL